MIAQGYPRADVWAMTPREIAGSLYFAARRKKRDAADRLALGALAAQGDGKRIKAQIEKLRKE